MTWNLDICFRFRKEISMGRGSALAASFVPVVLTATAVRIVEGELACETPPSAGLFWSTDKEEPNLLRKTEPHDEESAAASSFSSADAIVNDHDDSDGGFSSLDGMLQWAIAKDVQRLSTSKQSDKQCVSQSGYLPGIKMLS